MAKAAVRDKTGFHFEQYKHFNREVGTNCWLALLQVAVKKGFLLRENGLSQSIVRVFQSAESN